MPAWQKRHPRVQPRMISSMILSKMTSVYGTGISSG